jgi:RNA chaperone Hfq
MHKKSEKLTQDLQAQFLSKLCRERALVCIYLTKGTRLEGYIKAFDEYILYTKVLFVVFLRCQKKKVLIQRLNAAQKRKI